MKKKLSQSGELFYKKINDGLIDSPRVGIHLERYASEEGRPSLRTVQRAVKQIREMDEFETARTQDGWVFFSHEMFDVSDNVRLEWSDDVDTAWFVAAVPSASEAQDLLPSQNGSSRGVNNEYSELLHMVCSVCNKNPMLVMDDQMALVDLLFKAGVTPDEVYTHFHKQARPNFWGFHWKSKRGVRPPTIRDILDYIEDAKIWKPSYTETLPGYLKICEDFEQLQVELGREKGRTSFETLDRLGYGPLFKKIGLDWYTLNMNTVPKNRSLIKDALWALKDEEKEGTREPVAG